MIREINCVPLGINQYLVKNKHRYLVKVMPNGKNYCDYPKTTVNTRKRRGSGTVYFQYNTWNNTTTNVPKRISYDRSLWLDEVLINDPIENEIINIQNTWPNWHFIEVFPMENYLNI